MRAPQPRAWPGGLRRAAAEAGRAGRRAAAALRAPGADGVTGDAEGGGDGGSGGGGHGHRLHRPGRPLRLPAPTLDELLQGYAAAQAAAQAEAEADGRADVPPDASTTTPTASTAAAPATAPTAGSSLGRPAAPLREAVPAVPEPRAGRFGRPGRPLNRDHPFYLGFVGAAGVFAALGLVRVLDELSGVITLVAVSLFLALGLDPVVRALQRRGVPRSAAITGVFLALVGIVVGFVSAVVPPVVNQLTELTANAPAYLADVQRAVADNERLAELDARYGVTERVQAELQARLATGSTVTTVFGGLYGAGRAVASGVGSTLTVLVLTLYFLASLRTITATIYRLVPASRRDRIRLLGDEVIRRIGGYVIGQVSIAAVNGVLSYVVMVIVGVPYAAALALVVALVGLIPLVGATLGAIAVVVVALFSSVADAVVMTVWYVAYQQFENYVVAPRILARTVSVPGALTLVAALAGGSLLGVLGALVAIPIAAGVLLVVQEVVMPRQDRA